MRAKVWVVVFIAIIIIFGFVYICNRKSFSVVRSGDHDIQKVIAEVNQGIGEGRYEEIIIFHGKDPILISSCKVSTNEWEQISSKGEPRDGVSFAVREGFLTKYKNRYSLGAWRLNGIDHYGFIDTNGEMFMVIENFGDAGGKFPEKFWKIIMRNVQ